MVVALTAPSGAEVELQVGRCAIAAAAAAAASGGSGARPRLVCSTVPVRLKTGRWSAAKRASASAAASRMPSGETWKSDPPEAARARRGSRPQPPSARTGQAERPPPLPAAAHRPMAADWRARSIEHRRLERGQQIGSLKLDNPQIRIEAKLARHIGVRRLLSHGRGARAPHPGGRPSATRTCDSTVNPSRPRNTTSTPPASGSPFRNTIPGLASLSPSRSAICTHIPAFTRGSAIHSAPVIYARITSPALGPCLKGARFP